MSRVTGSRYLDEFVCLWVKEGYHLFATDRVLLLPQFLQQDQELAAAIPDRDTLCIAAAPADGDWSALEDLATTTGGEHLPLSRPLKVTRSGFELV